MTQFNLETTARLSIHSYTNEEINIALSGRHLDADNPDQTQRMTNSFILTPTEIIPNWRYNSVAELTADSFEKLIEPQPELVILGTGQTLRFPRQQILKAFHQAGIGIEVMNTASACRTYNVLVSENRFVIAGFLIV